MYRIQLLQEFRDGNEVVREGSIGIVREGRVEFGADDALGVSIGEFPVYEEEILFSVKHRRLK